MSSGTDAPQVRQLDRLDALLIASRRWLSRPGYRERMWSRLEVPVDLTTVRVLRAVERSLGADPSIGDVARELGIDPSTASRFVDRVVERGDLERRPCPEDGRRIRLALTKGGRSTLAAVTEARRKVLSEVTRDWGEGDIMRLAELLERLGEGYAALEDAR